MEDCECERRLSDPLDPPSEETMKRASDVLEHYLKTMRELNRKSKLPIEVTEEHIKIINRFMEEKKTKKMTKAEAFEYLEEKKVLSVDCALEHAKWIMKYLREECSPHTKMIIEGDHAELVEGVKSVVWEE